MQEIENIKWRIPKEQKEKKFKTDKALHDNLNCKHYRIELNQVIDHKNDRVEYYEICLDCGKII